MNRREFIKTAVASSALAATVSPTGAAEGASGGLIAPRAGGLPITGTFLDEISHDIPHQNWGAREWDADFAYMKAIGIDTVIMIRCGHQRYMTYPSRYLLDRGGYRPSEDLVELFLRLAERHGMKFFFGLYDPGYDGDFDKGWLDRYTEANLPIIEEVWKRYGHHASFSGWYLSAETGSRHAIDMTRRLSRQCKDVSSNLPTLISPGINGRKAVCSFLPETTKNENFDTVEMHERRWKEIFDAIRGHVDICAFQDGHVEFHELEAYLKVTRALCSKYGIACWTNSETFDRDMPIKFLPIKFDKLRMKLDAAKRCGCEKAITFEFSHFMSPQSMYPSAARLNDRYRAYFGI